MTGKTAEKDWFLDDITEDEFDRLSAEDQLVEVIESRLSKLPPEEQKSARKRLHEGTEEFVKEMRLKRLSN